MLRKRLFLPVLSVLCAFDSVDPSPVVLPQEVFDPDNLPEIPLDFCTLPPKLGNSGSTKFVEDCDHLDTFPNLPMPSFQKYGTHPQVCCPSFSKKAVCFPTDIWCPSYVELPTPTFSPEDLENYENNVNYEYYGDYDIVTEPTIFVEENVAKISDEDCSRFSPDFGNSTQCVNLKDCPGIFKPPYNTAPSENLLSYVGLCGWDEEDKTVKICCPNVFGAEIQDKSLRKVVEPRFPGYQCHDKVKQCQNWKNNDGCRTDMDFVIDLDDVDNGRADSKSMFDFMTGTCMETCGHCGDKGCRDEHPDCPGWARQGFCITNSDLMVHTCRESCGVCGFLSTDDAKEQVVGENTYSDFRSPRFDCGRYKKLTEVNNETKIEEESSGEDYDIRSVEMETTYKEEEQSEETTYKEEEQSEETTYKEEEQSEETTHKEEEQSEETTYKEEEQSEDEVVDVFFSNEGGHKFCGATLISDRWIITAAHCYDSFGISSSVRINTIRDNTAFIEVIEIKRIYKHPKYTYPTLYNDIALLELGRRVDYDWDKYGDTPMCIDRVGKNEGKIATIQGYGKTENGTLGDLLEANVTVISNSQCNETFQYNITKSPSKTTLNTRIQRGLPDGLNEKTFCTQGEANDAGVIRGSCDGDSGGPLFVEGDNGRQMLVGIVSGGIGCGQGYPNWYTKVAFYTSWIECIIDSSKMYKNNKDKIESKCNGVAEEADTSADDGDNFLIQEIDY